jgi:putative transposase
MIRRAQLSLNNSNPGKLLQLERVMDESLRVLNVFVGMLWEEKRFAGTFTKLSTDTWLSARMQQCLGKQALETVKSQRRRRTKVRPVIRKPVLNLDSRFLSFSEDTNSFDFWIHFGSPGEKISLNIPSRKHRHFNSFAEEGWELKKSGRLRKTDRGWFLDVYFEKETPPVCSEGSSIGVDCGYRKLLVCSDGQMPGPDFHLHCGRIARKQRGSKACRRSLSERDNRTGEAVNSLDLSGVSRVVVERLHSVKKNSKGRFRKSFNNKLQYWSYRQCLSKLQSRCERSGICFCEVDPAYTSQTCSSCGHVDRNSRKGEQFLCTRCGMSLDADFNASRDILMRGAYSPPSEKAEL